MTGNAWIRQIHRWLSTAFTAGFIANIVIVSQGKQPIIWVGLCALVPLVLLLLSGLYLFALPYLLKRGKRAARAPGAA
jgi:hypothetical protein